MYGLNPKKSPRPGLDTKGIVSSELNDARCAKTQPFLSPAERTVYGLKDLPEGLSMTHDIQALGTQAIRFLGQTRRCLVAAYPTATG